jgi:hypothetical protein
LPFRYRGSRRESAVAQLFSLGILAPDMNLTPKTKRHWWQTFVFAEEVYLASASFIFCVLAAERVEVDGSAVVYMVYSYLFVIVGSFISGVTLITSGKKKAGLIALAFAASAFVLLVLVVPAAVAAHRRG